MGRALKEYLPDALYLGRADCDVRDAVQVAAVLAREEPEVVIHAAAITDHQHPNTSEIIETNILGTEHVARICKAYSIKLVYLSTHYVYPGETGNYKETDPTKPIGTYAWSKLAGEGWAQTVPEWLIVRGSWYTPEKVLGWWRKGALTDAYHNRQQPREAAQRIGMLVMRNATGVYNIGHKFPDTFYRIAQFLGKAYGGEGERPRAITRAQLHGLVAQPDGSWLVQMQNPFTPPPPYAFPADSSVNTDKYEALVSSFDTRVTQFHNAMLRG